MVVQNNPLVTIGIPFYNSEKYLEFAICSVLNQTYHNWELFLMDDGSEDKSLSIARSFETDPRVSVISDGENKGLPSRLNELSALTNGLYYVRMDADDIMFPSRIQVQLRFLQQNPDVDVVGSNAISIDSQNRVIGMRKSNPANSLNQKYVLKNGCFIHPTVMGKSSWFKQNQYDVLLRRAQDFDLWVRTVNKSVFSTLDDSLLFYREGNIPTLKKYWIGKRFESRIVHKYRDALGNAEYVTFQMRNILKVSLYLLFYSLGRIDHLIHRRSLSLSNDQADDFREILNLSLKS
ncbi:glycosyltransferase family 2 protein [Marinilabilia sp.]|uniref:glycosyltransferase family 2 protein n=1 Tax=Marinilabilia sp. TaxID=2021252 RepID=UPI0025BA76E5|nr:glycosyltransferase family 2 protein [Marinilabilia sp.]